MAFKPDSSKAMSSDEEKPGKKEKDKDPFESLKQMQKRIALSQIDKKTDKTEKSDKMDENQAR